LGTPSPLPTKDILDLAAKRRLPTTFDWLELRIAL